MEINATLFIQIVNFIAAYVIMDRIVLRLAANIIQTEDRKIGALESEVSEHEKRITSRTRYNEDDWIILQKRLQSECPTVSVGQHAHTIYESSSQDPFISPEQVTTTAQPLKDILINNIVNGQD